MSPPHSALTPHNLLSLFSLTVQKINAVPSFHLDHQFRHAYLWRLLTFSRKQRVFNWHGRLNQMVLIKGQHACGF